MASVGFARQMARKTLRELSITSPPVEVESVAEAHGLTVERFDNWPEKLHGQLWRGQRVIGINGNDHHTRQRLTIAHELGHFVLHHDILEFVDHEGTIDDPEKDLDVEAYEFGGELLMPMRWIKSDYAKIRDAKKLALRYDVSEPALLVRLLKLGLIK